MKLYHALIAGLVACSFAIAQDSAATKPAPMPTTKTAKAMKAKAVKMVWGKIVSVDAIANTIIIKTKKAEDTLSTTEKTVILPKGTMIADLKADDKVGVGYMMEDGKMVATKITLNPVPKAKKAPKAPMAPAMGSNSAAK